MYRWIFATLLAATALAAHAHTESRFEPFDSERFAALQAEGRSILVDVWAPWCPTCRSQAPKLEALLAKPEFADFVGLKLHWDEQREAARALGAPRQSTLLVFRGGEQRALSVAETDADRLHAVLQTGLD
jgi:thioredoxin 1